MVLRMARPWKHPNSGVFYLRVRVPSDLVSLVGRKLEKQSLRTKDVGEARVRFSKAMADLTNRSGNGSSFVLEEAFRVSSGASAIFRFSLWGCSSLAGGTMASARADRLAARFASVRFSWL
ncbi:DUF6538 domain-containing protein [Aurantimonas coralicida]|uniref:DUF6538 domain-containing protein n=1 Tax=Aurantimonas coralicida TaxID=182270 RepID=UPI0023827452|nr:DUF6538 domain-containing protein [Aurantimonas coralicida]MDE0924129.1 hypothetical protein [Aurantimonas coralicida]